MEGAPKPVNKQEQKEEIKIPEGIDFVFEQYPEIEKIAQESFEPSFEDKKRIFEMLRLSLIDSVRNTEDYEKYNGKTLAVSNFSEDSYKLLLQGLGENNIDIHPRLNNLQKTFEEQYNQGVMPEDADVMDYFNPSTGAFSVFTSEREKETSLKKTGHDIELLKYLENKDDKAKEVYGKYLETIFPESQIKDIVYHGGPEGIEHFDKNAKSYDNIENRSKGRFFTGIHNLAKVYAEKAQIIHGHSQIYPVIVNITNPITVTDKLKLDEELYPNNDSIIHESSLETEKVEELVVFEPEQIHILGSQKDQEMFKEFLEHKKQQNKKYESILESLKDNESIELNPEEKMNFLNWAVQEKNYLLHGSNTSDIEELEPQLANCASKEFGNQEAVFANEDPNITMFYALRNKEFKGDTEVGSYTDEETSEVSYHFEFKGENVESEYCLKDGAIYLLNRVDFEQGHNDKGEIIDEWANKNLINPITKLNIKVEDFPYLNEIFFTQITSSPEKEYLKEKFGITNLDEFQQKFFEVDQELMKTGAFDYKNPELVNNQMKDILEQYNEDNLNQEQKQQHSEMLWLWYHHAAQDAKERYQENEKAIELIDKALEYKNNSNSPNEITELLSLIYKNKFDEAESYIQNMDDVRKEQQEDGSIQEIVNYEKETAQQLFEYYKSKN